LEEGTRASENKMDRPAEEEQRKGRLRSKVIDLVTSGARHVFCKEKRGGTRWALTARSKRAGNEGRSGRGFVVDFWGGSRLDPGGVKPILRSSLCGEGGGKGRRDKHNNGEEEKYARLRTGKLFSPGGVFHIGTRIGETLRTAEIASDTSKKA